MARLGDRVKETTTTTGTGTVTMLGAVAQFQAFATRFADGANAYYSIVGQTGTEWEVGFGTIGATGTTLARTSVLDSSNAGALVNFSAGTKDVFCTAPAIIGEIVETLKSGNFTLAGVDNGKRFVATAVITITVPAVGTLGNGFEVEIINDSGGTVTIDGPGSTNVSLDNGDVACILEANSKQRVAKGISTVIS